jgi:hypothetical protein
MAIVSHNDLFVLLANGTISGNVTPNEQDNSIVEDIDVLEGGEYSPDMRSISVN